MVVCHVELERSCCCDVWNLVCACLIDPRSGRCEAGWWELHISRPGVPTAEGFQCEMSKCVRELADVIAGMCVCGTAKVALCLALRQQ